MIKARQAINGLSEYFLPDSSRKSKQRMDHNENAWGCSDKVIDAIRNITAADISIYPLYSKFKEKLSKVHNLDPENIVLTNGADEGIRYLLEAFLTKEGSITMTDPTFSMYKYYSAMQEAIIFKVPLNGDFSFPFNRFKEKASQTDLSVIVNPGTPVGSTLDREQIITLLESMPDKLFILDEAYTEYRAKSDIDLIKRYPNLCVLRSFSKAYGLAGLRLGFIAGDPETVSVVKKIASPYNVNTLAIIAATAALDDTAFLNDVIQKTGEERLFLTGLLSKIGLKVIPGETNFIAVNFGDNCDLLCKELDEKGVLIKNLRSEPLMENWARITIGTREENHKLSNILKRELSMMEASV